MSTLVIRCMPEKSGSRWVTWTAFGSPLVPDVKIIMKVSIASTSRYGVRTPAPSSRSAHSSASVLMTRTFAAASSSAMVSTRCRCSSSVSSTWHSARRMSAESPAPRRVVLMPQRT